MHDIQGSIVLVSQRRTFKSKSCRQAGFPTGERGEIPGSGEIDSPESWAAYRARVFHKTLNHMAERAAIGNMLLVY